MTVLLVGLPLALIAVAIGILVLALALPQTRGEIPDVV